MIDLPKPGAYVVRAPHANHFSQGLVQHWLNSQEETPFKSCLWLTASPKNEVRSFLEPYLLTRTGAPKGLDVVSVRNLWPKGHTKNGIRQLCRSLNTLCVLKPALVIIDHAELWFNDNSEPVSRQNPLAQMRLLHQWAHHAQAHVVTTVQGDLPEWCTFADGLADVSDHGEFEFRPWWPTQWGLQTNLWNDPTRFSKLPIHHVLDSRVFGSLKQLAQTCHRLRFDTNELHGIHVQARGEMSAQDASVLIRMGADTVWLQEENIETWLGITAMQLHKPTLIQPATENHQNTFARDLHEVFMPGLLTVVANPTFAAQGLMMLQLSKQWSMHCTLTRLSLMHHMTAQTALRLANWSQATCVFTATREAIYLLKVWVSEPDDTSYRNWLESCFRENLPVLFSGDIQFLGEETQSELLADLHEELEPLSVEDLMGTDLSEPAKLAELWDETPEAMNQNRPWTQRLSRLLGEEAK
ncbi:hypothetical protein [uncultured Limnobacter sp.]|uniref:hypothetical protein n=1 Tax=uncultured Limnobacter sp. TaxID=199681 RepID=UPI0030F91EB7